MPRCSTQLSAWGCPVEPHWERCEGVDALLAFCDEWRDERRGLQFETDGVVIKLDDLALRAQLGDDGEVSALGRRLQVSRRAGHHAADPDRRERRPHRRA